MKKKTTFIALGLMVSNLTFAGGILTNTNQNIAFNRNFARNATFEIDGAYSNPAGLAWLGNGFHISANIQSAFQNRIINTTYAPFAANTQYPADENGHKRYKGEAAAPVIPSLQAAYQRGPWTISMNFAVTGGGGKATFNEGLPMFESQVAYAAAATGQAVDGVNTLAGLLGPAGSALMMDKKAGYSLDTYMRGRQYVYGLQVGLTYKIFENRGKARQGLAVYAGARMNYVSNRYEGYMRNMSVVGADGMTTPLSQYMGEVSEGAKTAAQTALAVAHTPMLPEATKGQLNGVAAQLNAASEALEAGANRLNRDIELDCSQSGWGLTPIIGVDYRVGNLNLGARYEFRTNLNIENESRVNTTGVAAYNHGVNTPNDLPAILSVGAQYEILPTWRMMAGMTYYFDKDAGMAGGKQKALAHNTREFMVGTEWDVLSRLTLSGGYMNTNYGATNNFQSDLSFSCDSYSLGFGVKVKITPKFDVNVAYFWTNYKDFTKEQPSYQDTGIPGTDVYSRTNKVFGLGVNFRI